MGIHTRERLLRGDAGRINMIFRLHSCLAFLKETATLETVAASYKEISDNKPFSIAILQKILDRGIFLYNFIREVR